MISIYSYRPELFNNNGDQGSIEVLIAALTEAGVSYSLSEAVDADFVLIGDCSIAVLEKYRKEILALAPQLRTRLEKGKPTLIVGRAYELLAPELGISTQTGERESKFCLESVGQEEFFGYHNSIVTSPKVFKQGTFIGTTLFGPFLAKNANALVELLSIWGVSADGPKMKLALEYAKKVREVTSFD